jgi:hypothetical protein
VTDLRDDMTKAVEGQIEQLARRRGARYVDAAVVVAQSYAANLRDSRETGMEPYWTTMVAIADGIVSAELGSRR